MPEKKSSKFVLKIQQYTDDKGRFVQRRELVQGEYPPGFCEFVGLGQIATRDGRYAVEGFDLPGCMSVVSAFADWPAAFVQHCKNNQVQAVTPIEGYSSVISHVDRYVNDLQQLIEETVALDNSSPPKYEGRGSFQLPDGTTYSETFPIEAASIKEAYEKYPAALDATTAREARKFTDMVRRLEKAAAEKEKVELQAHKKKLILPS